VVPARCAGALVCAGVQQFSAVLLRIVLGGFAALCIWAREHTVLTACMAKVTLSAVRDLCGEGVMW
jgi:hypothetical protein